MRCSRLPACSQALQSAPVKLSTAGAQRCFAGPQQHAAPDQRKHLAVAIRTHLQATAPCRRSTAAGVAPCCGSGNLRMRIRRL